MYIPSRWLLKGIIFISWLRPIDVGSGGSCFLELLHINCLVILKFTSFSIEYLSLTQRGLLNSSQTALGLSSLHNGRSYLTELEGQHIEGRTRDAMSRSGIWGLNKFKHLRA